MLTLNRGGNNCGLSDRDWCMCLIGKTRGAAVTYRVSYCDFTVDHRDGGSGKTLYNLNFGFSVPVAGLFS